MQRRPRQLARELALLTLGQLSKRQFRPEDSSTTPQALMLAAVHVLVAEAQDNLEMASTELSQGHDRLHQSELTATSLTSSQAMVADAIELSQKAINRISLALELPELIQMVNLHEVRDYALEIAQRIIDERERVDQTLNGVMVDWQLSRLPHIDQDILRIAVVEILFLGTPHQVAINEAVELVKRYSDEESRRLINGILRRVVTSLNASQAPH